MLRDGCSHSRFKEEGLPLTSHRKVRRSFATLQLHSQGHLGFTLRIGLPGKAPSASWKPSKEEALMPWLLSFQRRMDSWGEEEEECWRKKQAIGGGVIWSPGRRLIQDQTDHCTEVTVLCWFATALQKPQMFLSLIALHRHEWAFNLPWRRGFCCSFLPTTRCVDGSTSLP